MASPRTTRAQLAARAAFSELARCRAAWGVAAARGREAASALANAHLTASYAPAWPLPPAVAALDGLQAAVARKLARRSLAALGQLLAALEQLTALHAAMRAAAALLSAPDAGQLGAAPVFAALHLAALESAAQEVVAMHGADLELRGRLVAGLAAVARRDAAAAGVEGGEAGEGEGPSRDELAAWLAVWVLAPRLDARRLGELDARLAEEQR